jgi:oligopeptide/dipeptide ABC transporter ATP-binding protein
MRQRVAMAIALAPDPAYLIADEPTTALDVTIQAQILDLLVRERDARGMGLLLITHDLGVVARIADRVCVMYAGRIVESGPVEILAAPRHPYTARLLMSVPRLDGARPERLASIPGTPPAPGELVLGCAFAPRCAAADERCVSIAPEPEFDGHAYECWHPETATRA